MYIIYYIDVRITVGVAGRFHSLVFTVNGPGLAGDLWSPLYLRRRRRRRRNLHVVKTTISKRRGHGVKRRTEAARLPVHVICPASFHVRSSSARRLRFRGLRWSRRWWAQPVRRSSRVESFDRRRPFDRRSLAFTSIIFLGFVRRNRGDSTDRGRLQIQ